MRQCVVRGAACLPNTDCAPILSHFPAMKTIREIVTFINVGSPYVEKHPRENKLRYALKKTLKAAGKLWDGYNEQVEDLDIEHCATDKDGVIRLDANGHKEFTKEGLKKRNAARKVLFETAVEFTPYLAKDIPEDLTEGERDAFAGFVLPEASEE